MPVVIEGALIAENFKDPFMQYIINNCRIALDPKLTVFKVMEYLRKVLKLSGNRALFIQIHNKILDHYYTIQTAYDNYKDEDGFIYIFLKSEDSF